MAGGSILTGQQTSFDWPDEETRGQQSRPLLMPGNDRATVEIEPEDEFLTPKQTMIAAQHLPPPKTRAPSSIWAVAAKMAKYKGPPPPKATPAAMPLECVKRENGITRVSGAQYPANRWTAEREEVEQERRKKIRAYVKSNNPNKHRTRSKKLRTLLGEDV